MKALEFKSKIKNNQISIPDKIQSELRTRGGKNVRVILLLDDLDNDEEAIFRQSAKSQFLQGYADTDSVYDTY